MRFIKVYILGTILIIFTGCKSNISAPSKYVSSCYYTDAPAYILHFKKNNYFILRSIPSYEKYGGKWSIKNDTLELNSEYKSSLENENDSIVYKEKKEFILKGKKLINPLNEKCFLILNKK